MYAVYYPSAVTEDDGTESADFVDVEIAAGVSSEQLSPDETTDRKLSEVK